MHLNQLFAYGGVNRNLLPQNFHLGVRHHLHVQHTPISISISTSTSTNICILLNFFFLLVVVMVVLFLLLPLHTFFFFFFFFSFLLITLSPSPSQSQHSEYTHQKVNKKETTKKMVYVSVLFPPRRTLALSCVSCAFPTRPVFSVHEKTTNFNLQESRIP